MADTEMVVVDIGTGYYVRKVSTCFPTLDPYYMLNCSLQKRSEAREHYNSKSTFIQGNLETLQKTIERKQENVQMVVQVLQMKLQGGRSGK